jgi:hypothetical protein
MSSRTSVKLSDNNSPTNNEKCRFGEDIYIYICLFAEKLNLLEPSDQKRKEGHGINAKEAKQSKRGKRGGKNEDMPEERTMAEISKVIALKARLAKKKERPRKIKAVIDQKVRSSGKTGKSEKLYNAHAIKGIWLWAGYKQFLCFMGFLTDSIIMKCQLLYLFLQSLIEM